MDDHLLHFLRGLGVPVAELYGAAETTGVGALNPADSFERDAVGEPMAGTELALSEDGELLVRGPNVMVGYAGDERTTKRAVRDGWYRTGDTGRWDAERGILHGE
jgi:long-subunit acyl-CoA synthetase (AMP-forming)